MGSVLHRTRTGLEELLAQGCDGLRGRRAGLLVHPASVDGSLRPTAELLHDHPRVDLRVLFGPQHGINGETQDNMIEWEGFRDPVTGLPIHSLYGQQRKPTEAMLADIDVLVVDLQDVGARYYTFIWTMLLCLEACAESGRQMVVLDRPNPLGGLAREGALPEPGYESFVGLAPLPMRHGLTMGELARMWNDQRGLGVDLEVVAMQGWERSMVFDATGLPWVLPSPNMPTLETAWVYPGGCLLEGTNLSEGRGTTRPFEILGAPFIDPHALVSRMAAFGLPGFTLRPLSFQPTFHKFAGRVCGGVQVHVTDRGTFGPVATFLALLMAIRELYPEDFAWRDPPYEYEVEKLPIDILAGGPWLRRAVDGADPLAEVIARWTPELTSFDEEAARYRIYG